MTPRNPVLITDGLWRKSLSAIRSLGKSGYLVHVMGNSLFTTGFWSKFTVAKKRAPTASDDPNAFGKALLTYLATFSTPPILLPMEDATLVWVSEHRKELEGLARFVIPSEHAIEIAEDKSLTLAFAQKIGTPTPKTFWPKTATEAIDVIHRELSSSEWVIKPTRGSGSKGILYGAKTLTTEEKRKLEEHWQTHGACLIQERIPHEGRAIGASFLFGKNGELLADFLHERLQQYPLSGGPSTDRVSIHHSEIREASLKLLRELKWCGIAMVEWKIDPRDRQFKLMEINPRFWGSVELAVRAGVDFPTLYAELCEDRPRSVQATYKDGVRCRWMIPGDILRYLGSPTRESFLDFLKGLPAVAEEWDVHDLKGALATAICTALLALNPRYWKYLRRG